MKDENIPKRLHRYTSLPILLDLLQQKKLAFVGTAIWEKKPSVDRNDVENLKIYEKQTGKNIYAICFTQEEESHFYWESIGGGADCRITFDGSKLIDSLKKFPGISYGEMLYKKIPELKKEIDSKTIKLKDIPFIKRHPYRLEKEYRIIWEGKKENSGIKTFDIALDAITSVSLSDNIPCKVADSVKEALKNIEGFKPERISQVTVHQNDLWIKYLQDGIKNLK